KTNPAMSVAPSGPAGTAGVGEVDWENPATGRIHSTATASVTPMRQRPYRVAGAVISQSATSSARPLASVAIEATAYSLHGHPGDAPEATVRMRSAPPVPQAVSGFPSGSRRRTSVSVAVAVWGERIHTRPCESVEIL